MTQLPTTKPSRKRSTDTPIKNPAASQAMKQFWRDPERVAAWREKHDAQMAARRADPDKNWSRRGIPDGMTRAEADTMWASARARAALTADALEAQGILSSADEDGRMAKEALTDAIAVMRTEYNQRTRVAAARLVLEFTMGKPARQRGVTVKSAEDWLSTVATGGVEQGSANDTATT